MDRDKREKERWRLRCASCGCVFPGGITEVSGWDAGTVYLGDRNCEMCGEMGCHPVQLSDSRVWEPIHVP